MQHDAHGWWIAEAGAPAPLPALTADVDADVVVIGGGFTGMWSAWHLLEADPDLRIVLLEGDRCGFGPSGRNGGFVQAMTLSRPTLRELFGARGGDDLVAAAEASVARDRRLVRGRGRRRLVPRRAAPDRPRRPGSGHEVRARGRGRRRRRARRRPGPRAVRLAAVHRRPRGGGRRDGAARAARLRAAGAPARPRRAHPRALARPLARGRRRGDRHGPRARPDGGRRRRPGERRAAAAAQPPDGLLEPHRPHRARPGRGRGARLDRRRGDQRRAHAAALPAHDPGRPDPVRVGRRADGDGRADGRPDGGRPRGDRPREGRPRALLPGARRADRSSARGAGRSTSRRRTCRS